MKKLISVFLTLVMVLSLCACADSQAEKTTQPQAQGGGTTTTEEPAEGLLIGYARESIMPNNPVNISGGGNQAHRLSVGFLDILYATCLAITEGDTTILLYSTDTLAARTGWTNEARKLISEATGVPEANIQIGGTHTHSGPAVGGGEAPVLEWKPIYMDALVNSAKAAIADQAPTTLYGAKVQTEGMTFVRHYKMQDGSYAGSNFGDFSKGIVDHATTPDEEMILLKMEREGDKKDILLMNFQGHPCFSGGTNYNDLSADYIATVRDEVEKQTGMQFIYFLGSTGNQNTNSKIASEEGPQNADRFAYGAALAKYAVDALPTMEKIEGTGVKTTQKIVTYKSNDYGQDRLEEAKLPYEMYRQNGDSAQATKYAQSLGFQSVFECNGIVNCSNYPPTGDIELNTCSFGGVGFVAASYEMFAASGMYIKENSPFAFTIISTCTNGYNNYFPTKEAFAYGCYESYTARFASGVAEDIADELVGMLKEVQ